MKKYKIDIILISVLLVASIIGAICFSVLSKSENLLARIYVKNNLIHEIDLAKEKEPRLLDIDGSHGKVVVQVSKNDIKVIESSCPGKDCIKQGSATSLKPIICAYNDLKIELFDNDNFIDVEI